MKYLLESIVAATILLALVCNFIGTRVNRRKARQWWEEVRPLLQKEFFSVGVPDTPTGLETRGKDEFVGYATGRLGIRSAHLKLALAPRHTPTVWLMDALTGFFFDQKDTGDRFTLTLTPADGADGERTRYDDCIFALVHKNSMQQWRRQRYDLSLTRTSDHATLPPWLAIMSESSEITEALLPELRGLDQQGLHYLLASDLPAAAPTKLADWKRQKRITVYASMGKGDSSLVRAAITLVDVLMQKGHFRQEVLQRLKSTREEEERRVRKLDSEDKREELERKKATQRKEQKGNVSKLPAEEQRKAREKERERQQRRRQRVQK